MTTGVPISVPITTPTPKDPSRMVSQTRSGQPRPEAM
jgi:hypothetical protein